MIEIKQAYFVTAYLFGAVTIALAQSEFKLLAEIERTVKANEPEWKLERVSAQVRPAPMHIENGRPLLSPLGEYYGYRLTSGGFTGGVSLFRGDSPLDARNQLEWLRRMAKMNEMHPADRIGEQSYQTSGHGAGWVMFRKTNIVINVHVMPVEVSKGAPSPSVTEEKTALALSNAVRIAKRIAEQLPGS